MDWQYHGPGSPLNTRPDRQTGTMAEWKQWVDSLTRYERDQLYPGMHIDLIPAYEKIVGMEEQGQPPSTRQVRSWGHQSASESTRPDYQTGVKSTRAASSITPQPYSSPFAIQALFGSGAEASSIPGTTDIGHAGYGNVASSNSGLANAGFGSPLLTPSTLWPTQATHSSQPTSPTPGFPTTDLSSALSPTNIPGITTKRLGLLDFNYANNGGSRLPSSRNGSGTRTRSPDSVARSILRSINPTSIAQNVEYGGSIDRIVHGDGSLTYVASAPKTDGKADRYRPKTNPDTTVGHYHTHADYKYRDPETGKPVRVPLDVPDRKSRDEYDSDKISVEDGIEASYLADDTWLARFKHGETYKLWVGTPSGRILSYTPPQ